MRRPKTTTLTVSLARSLHRRVELDALNAGQSEAEVVRDALALWFKRSGQRVASNRVLVPGTMWDYANHYLAAAGALLKADPLDAARFHPSLPLLVGLSVEASLKAFLSARGMTEGELRNPKRFGHNLVKLLAAARRRKLDDIVRTTARDRQVIGWLNRLYEPRDLAYATNVPGEWIRKTAPPALRQIALAEKLTTGLRPICKVRPAVSK